MKLLTICIFIMTMFDGNSQVSDRTLMKIEKNKQFFSSHIIGNSFSYKWNNQDSLNSLMFISYDSLLINYNGIIPKSVSYPYKVRFGRFDRFTIELLVQEKKYYLECYFPDQKESSNFFLFQSFDQHLWYDGRDYISENGSLMIKKNNANTQ